MELGEVAPGAALTGGLHSPRNEMIAQEEAFPNAIEELQGLLVDEWEELALDQTPLDPDWDVYVALHNLGRLLFVALRDDAKLVGYYIGIVSPHLHHKGCLTGSTDTFYVHPSVRGRFGGLRLMRAVEQSLRARGVNRWVAFSNDRNDSSRLFKALGFEQIETTHSKWIGN